MCCLLEREVFTWTGSIVLVVLCFKEEHDNKVKSFDAQSVLSVEIPSTH